MNTPEAANCSVLRPYVSTSAHCVDSQQVVMIRECRHSASPVLGQLTDWDKYQGELHLGMMRYSWQL